MYDRLTYGDQSLNLNGYTISGIQSFNASYQLPDENVLALGGGVYRATNQDVVGSVSFQKKIVGEDNLFQLISGSITGHLAYGANFFGFTKGYINSYVANAQVNDIPTLDIDFTAFGQFGSGVTGATLESPVTWLRQSVTHGDITLSIDGQEATNRVQSFSYNVSVGRRPRYLLGEKSPSYVLVDWPIEIETTFRIDIDDYGFQEISGAVCSPREKDLVLTLRACNSTGIVLQLKAPKSKLLGEAAASAIGQNMQVTATYRGFYNSYAEML